MSRLPITAKLNPFAGAHNWVYLMQSTAITRLCTGSARVWENRPSVNQDPSLTENEKRQACLERFFVEIVGTVGYLGFLHLGQDVMAKVMDPKIKRKLNQLISKIEDPATGLSKVQAQQAKNALTSVYGDDSHQLIERYLYGYQTSEKSARTQVNLAQMKKTLNNNELFHYLRTSVPLDEFTSMLRHRAAASILGGVAVSALFGGLVTQWLNDRVFAPMVRQGLNKWFKPAPVETPQQGDEQFSGPQTEVSKLSVATAGSAAAMSSPFATADSLPRPAASPYMPPRAWSNALGGLPR